MNSHWKKLIAPVVVVVALLVLIGRIVVLLLKTNPLPPITLLALGLALPAIITIILIMVLVERIKEIKKGEEDDLGKY